MKVIWKGNIGEYNVEVRRMIGANDISFIPGDVVFTFNCIKDAGAEEDDMTPYFL